ncbi:unnamed protein product [Arctia plantaginis]|uniref:Uncharacterized protein n=1 Tax=Arctia plantaginis TaxID=874455 RepID=A0A8S1AGW6_ARCPL|nr:unnamed protein product [Arctia plantaginis]
MRRTGGGAADSLPALSALDKRLVAVMGGLDFAAGDQNLRVNPFSELVSAAQETRSFRPAVESSVISEDSDMQHSMQSITEDPGPFTHTSNNSHNACIIHPASKQHTQTKPACCENR